MSAITSIYASQQFWVRTGERAVKTFAQTALALFGAGQLTTIVELDWQQVAGLAATAALLSVLTSMVSAPIGPDTDPSVVA